VAFSNTYYAYLVGKLYLKEFNDLEVYSEITSELKYRNYKFNEENLFLAFSQSEETTKYSGNSKISKRKRGFNIRNN